MCSDSMAELVNHRKPLMNMIVKLSILNLVCDPASIQSEGIVRKGTHIHEVIEFPFSSYHTSDTMLDEDDT